MKILLVNTQRYWRGGERQTYLLAKGLKNLGVGVSVLTFKNSPLQRKLSEEGIKNFGVSSPLQALKFLRESSEEFKLLHTHNAKDQDLLILTKPLHKKPVVYTRSCHVAPRSLLSKLKYKKTDRVIAISDYVKNLLSSSIRGLRVLVIRDGVEELRLNRKRAEELLNSLNLKGKKVVGITSAFVPHKDPITCVETAYELSKLRKDFTFLHFGDGPLKEKIERLIFEKKLQNYYKIMGFYEKVEDYFSIFDVFLITSEDEALGSSVLDAFLYKVPVVSTDAGGLKELVEGRGILCKVKDAKCLADAINKLLEDKKLKERLTQRAYEYAKKEHDYLKVSERYLRVFEGLTC